MATTLERVIEHIKSIVTKLRTDVSNVYTKTETDTALSGKQDVISDLDTIRSNATAVTTKQDVITDLDTIRAGSAAGATALQSVPDEYVTETELTAKGYLTEHQDLTGYAKKTDIPDISGKEDSTNKVTTLSADSTDTQYPSAKCVYDLLGNVETLLSEV